MKLVLKSENTAIQHGQVIVDSIQGLIDAKMDFLAFIVLMTGIEYLGAFLDHSPFNKYGKSEARFTSSLKTLFSDVWYEKNALWFFRQVRGPLLHQFRTGDSVLLTSFCVHKVPLTDNRKQIEGKTQIVLEQVFADFKEAYEKLKTMAETETEKIQPAKRDKPFSAVFSYSDVYASGTTSHPDVTGTTATAIMQPTQARPVINTFPKLKKKKR